MSFPTIITTEIHLILIFTNNDKEEALYFDQNNLGGGLPKLVLTPLMLKDSRHIQIWSMHKFNPIKQTIIWAVSYNLWHTSIVTYAKTDWNPDCTCLQRDRDSLTLSVQRNNCWVLFSKHEFHFNSEFLINVMWYNLTSYSETEKHAISSNLFWGQVHFIMKINFIFLFPASYK